MARWKKRSVANHMERAAECRRHPSVWVEIGSYNCSQSAKSTARFIRTADERTPQYRPAGAYQTRVRLTDDGAVVFARYTGPMS